MFMFATSRCCMRCKNWTTHNFANPSCWLLTMNMCVHVFLFPLPFVSKSVSTCVCPYMIENPIWNKEDTMCGLCKWYIPFRFSHGGYLDIHDRTMMHNRYVMFSNALFFANDPLVISGNCYWKWQFDEFIDYLTYLAIEHGHLVRWSTWFIY